MHYNRKHFCTFDFFERIDSEEKAYWLGFLAADGHITKDRRRLYLGLNSKDENHLIKFSDSLKSTYPIKSGEKKWDGKISIKKRIVITSKQLVKDLIKNGVEPQKSLTLKPPKFLKGELIRHWIRGYFDGDGSIGFSARKFNFQISITSTKEVLEFITEYFKIKGHIYHKKHHHKNTFKFQMRGNNQVFNFLSTLYENSTLFLNRKYKKYLKLKRWRSIQSDESNKRYHRVN